MIGIGINTEQAGYLNIQPGFFPCLTNHAILESFTNLHDSTRQRPITRVATSLHKHTVEIIHHES